MKYNLGDLVVPNPEGINLKYLGLAGAIGRIVDLIEEEQAYTLEWDNGSISRYNWRDHELLSYPLDNRRSIPMLIQY